MKKHDPNSRPFDDAAAQMVLARLEEVEGCLDTPCWEWTSLMNNHGYGRVNIDGKWFTVHRYMYQYENGVTLENKEFVLHKCDNRACANPDHLFVGTHKDNMRDMVAKGRSRHLGRFKLNQEQAEAIIQKRHESDLGYKRIADWANEKWGTDITKAAVVSIVKGKSWRWLDRPWEE